MVRMTANPKCIEERKNHFGGVVGLGYNDKALTRIGTVKDKTHDGDTVFVRALGNLGIRFLAMDTPEVSFSICDDVKDCLSASKCGLFPKISHEAWKEYLSDPFKEGYPEFTGPSGNVLDNGLKAYLASRAGPDAAANHAEHARKATEALVGYIEKDRSERTLSEGDFKFYIAFCKEIMDRYGRFLAYVNVNEQNTSARPPTYNERLLKDGFAAPYFIYPNIDPFIKEKSVEPGEFWEAVGKSKALRDARNGVKSAREEKKGIFGPASDTEIGGLSLLPCEVRFLGRRALPDRYVIDLAKKQDKLLNPQAYYTVEIEDRLYLPPEYVPLFEKKGWNTGS